MAEVGVHSYGEEYAYRLIPRSASSLWAAVAVGHMLSVAEAVINQNELPIMLI